MEGALRKELETYQAKKSELIGQARNKFVLIKDDQVIDVFDTEMDAIRQGYERLGNVPFLVKQVLEIDLPQNYTSNLLRI